MTVFLTLLLIWILVGGGLYLFIVSNPEEAYRVCREKHIPDELFDAFFRSREMLILFLILGLPLVISAPIVYIFICLEGGRNEK